VAKKKGSARAGYYDHCVISFRLSVFCAAALFAARVLAVTPDTPWPARERHNGEELRPSGHELKDIRRWPAEPESPPGPLDPARFRMALAALCQGWAPTGAVGRLGDSVREAAAEASVDPFLLGALVYRDSRCKPELHTRFGIGLLQIQPHMVAANVHGSNLVYQVRAGEAWTEKTRPLPRGALYPGLLKQVRHNLRVGAAVLGMWQDQHPDIDQAFPASVPHRTAVAHFGWGDVVRGTVGEDRAFIARRRLLEHYLGTQPVPHLSPLGISVVSPLEGAPRVAPSGPGEDRDQGARAHRGLDIDANVGEPVLSLADGVVAFAGFDMPGRVAAMQVPAQELARTPRPEMGPGGLFVCVRHEVGILSCYMHLAKYRVHVDDRVKAGDRLGAVGRSGTKHASSHLHLQVYVNGHIVNPAPILGPELVIPPKDNVAHDVAMRSKRLRLREERRARRTAQKEAAAAKP
jgi:hypothetical protein